MFKGRNFDRFVERPVGILRVSPFIYHIDNSRGRSPQRRSLSRRGTPFFCARIHAFSVCNLSSFHEKEKETSVFSSSLVTCAPELCMPPLTSNMLLEYIGDTTSLYPPYPVIHRDSPFKPCVSAQKIMDDNQSFVNERYRENLSCREIFYVSLLERKTKIVRSF